LSPSPALREREGPDPKGREGEGLARLRRLLLSLPIDTPHFDRWLALFADTANAICPPAAAAHFIDRAYRIADSLELGIAAGKGEIRPRRARPSPTNPIADRAG